MPEHHDRQETVHSDTIEPPAYHDHGGGRNQTNDLPPRYECAESAKHDILPPRARPYGLHPHIKACNEETLQFRYQAADLKVVQAARRWNVTRRFNSVKRKLGNAHLDDIDLAHIISETNFHSCKIYELQAHEPKYIVPPGAGHGEKMKLNVVCLCWQHNAWQIPAESVLGYKNKRRALTHRMNPTSVQPHEEQIYNHARKLKPLLSALQKFVSHGGNDAFHLACAEHVSEHNFLGLIGKGLLQEGTPVNIKAIRERLLERHKAALEDIARKKFARTKKNTETNMAMAVEVCKNESPAVLEDLDANEEAVNVAVEDYSGFDDNDSNGPTSNRSGPKEELFLTDHHNRIDSQDHSSSSQ